MTFRTINDLSDALGVSQQELRSWEGKFPQLRPVKRSGGRRYYRQADVDLLERIHALLCAQGHGMEEAQRRLSQQSPVQSAVAVPSPVAAPGPVAVVAAMPAEAMLEGDESMPSEPPFPALGPSDLAPVSPAAPSVPAALPLPEAVRLEIRKVIAELRGLRALLSAKNL